MYIRPCFDKVLQNGESCMDMNLETIILNSSKAKLGQLIFKQHFIEDSTP